MYGYHFADWFTIWTPNRGTLWVPSQSDQAQLRYTERRMREQRGQRP